MYIEYYNPEGDRYGAVVNYGWVYIMQEGKTIDRQFVKAQDDAPQEESNHPISDK